MTPAEPDSRRRVFCSETSRERGEPLGATASRVDHWILVEYRGGWSRDPVDQSLLSAELKAHLREQRDALGQAKVLFVRKPERRDEAGRRVVFGTSRPGEERLLELEVEHHEDLRGFDFAAALASASAGTPVEGPLYLVCTHGKRDRCCARYGRPLYDALRERTDAERVWQSSHVGGDRFAGNVVVLPHGLYYGRIAPDDVDGLLAAQAAGSVVLERFRGRSSYPFRVQAAEQAIRESTGVVGIDDLAFLGSRRVGDGVMRARFEAPGSTVHEIDVAGTLDDEAAYLTCGSDVPRRARRCRVVSHRVLSR
ncbi:MAG TPA: sucrase ferredoxin [Gaiellaceae bacterium]|nr:sucrase ferredoxin [Gaiellaceae bacterium]